MQQATPWPLLCALASNCADTRAQRAFLCLKAYSPVPGHAGLVGREAPHSCATAPLQACHEDSQSSVVASMHKIAGHTAMLRGRGTAVMQRAIPQWYEYNIARTSCMLLKSDIRAPEHFPEALRLHI